MTDHPQIPEEVVEEIAIDLWGYPHIAEKKRLRKALCHPSLRQAILTEVEETLLSDETIEMAHTKGSQADPQLRPVNRAVIVAAFEAALASLKEGKG